MKKLIFMLVAVLAASLAARADVTINSTNFPDANFRSYLLSEYPSGTITTAQLNARTTLEVNNKSISNMKGVEYFTELTRLSCYSNNLTTIDVSKNTKLLYLNVYRNQLTSITGLDNCTVLEQLYLHYNKLTTLVVNDHSALRTLWVHENPNLVTVNCYRNALTNFNVSNCTSLNRLRCFNNPNLTSISGLDSCTKLTYLDCENCAISDLSALSSLTSLQTLLASYNSLTTLDISSKRSLTTLWLNSNKSLTSLECDACGLTSLEVGGCTALKTLDCSNNSNLTEVSGLAACTAMQELICYSCALTDLSAVQGFSKLKRIVASDNNLTSFTLNNSSTLWQLWLDDNAELTSVDACANGALSAFNVTGCTALETLNCYDNPNLTEITGISDCKAMKQLDCSRCALTSLDVAAFNSLQKLTCSRNNLSTLKVTGCRALEELRCFYNSPLTAITGLTTCTALTYLDCEDCAITNLYLTGLDNLVHIYARNNQLTSFYKSSSDADNNLPLQTLLLAGNTQLQEINCYNAQLINLDVTGCTALEYLFCYNNSLTSIDLSTLSSLKRLYCNQNQLTSLDVSHCPSLELLWCNNNKLSCLDLSAASADFFSLDCSYNQMTGTIDVSRFSKLYQVAINNNQLSQFTLGTHPELKDIWANANQLTSIDISGCDALERLYAPDNLLTTLDASGHSNLTTLYVQKNRLTSLNVNNCPALLELTIFYNQIKADAMGQLVNGLPTCTANATGTIYTYVNDNVEDDRVDGNVITASQVSQAGAKYWNILQWIWTTNEWVPYEGVSSLRGDVDGSGNVNIDDVTTLIDLLLSGATAPAAADCDQSGHVSIDDVTTLIDFLLSGVWN
ncbi:MAG: leucine-rich repeat domain-containing protein [Muribaculaceae bacterium]|nr:leucine-rich repeat domain-containing protein [Muribaculaceae bacterium]